MSCDLSDFEIDEIATRLLKELSSDYDISLKSNLAIVEKLKEKIIEGY